MRLGHYAKHLMHRRCETCWSAGFAAGFHSAAVIAERDQRLRDGVWRQGLDPDKFEADVRRRIADAEAGRAA